MLNRDGARMIQGHFDRLATRWGDDVRASDWSSAESQARRFRVFLQLGDLQDRRVLDVGCGRGDLLDFLQDAGLSVAYMGIDLSPDIVATARQRHPGADIHLGDVLSAVLPRMDYVVGSGIHYLDTGDNEFRARRMIRRMWELAERGMATNMLSRRRPASIELAPEAYSYDPVTIGAFGPTLTPDARVVEDYLPHDFTLLLRRSPAQAARRGCA